MLKPWADKIKGPTPSIQRDYMSCPRSWWESVAKEGPVSWGREGLIQGLTHKPEHLWANKGEGLQQYKACCACSIAVSRDSTSCRPGWAIIRYLRPSRPSSHRRKCLWRRPGAPRPHTPPRHSHSRFESHPLQNCRHSNKWTRWNKKEKASKPVIPWRPSTDLADAARGKREGQEQVSTPSYLLPTSSGNAQRQFWFISDCSITSSPNKKMLDHTASPEQSCMLYSLIWGFAPAQTSLITFLHLIQTPPGISSWLSHW